MKAEDLIKDVVNPGDLGGAFTVVHGKKSERDAVIKILVEAMELPGMTIIINPDLNTVKERYKHIFNNKNYTVYVYYEIPDYFKSEMNVIWLREHMSDIRRMNTSMIVGINKIEDMDYRLYNKIQYKIYVEGTDHVSQSSLIDKKYLKKLKDHHAIIEYWCWGQFKYES